MFNSRVRVGSRVVTKGPLFGGIEGTIVGTKTGFVRPFKLVRQYLVADDSGEPENRKLLSRTEFELLK